MIIIPYLLSLIAFYITYMLIVVILGRLTIVIKEKITKKDIQLEGISLMGVSFVANFTSYYIVLFIFYWLSYNPNWYILTPILVLSWFYFAPKLFAPHFDSGAAHWGILLSVITFLLGHPTM